MLSLWSKNTQIACSRITTHFPLYAAHSGVFLLVSQTALPSIDAPHTCIPSCCAQDLGSIPQWELFFGSLESFAGSLLATAHTL